MPQAATLTRTRAKRKLRIWHYAVAIPVAFAVTGWIIAAILTRSAQARLDRELALLKAAGIPTTLAEMPGPPARSENAATDYRLAIASYNRIGRAPPGTTPGYGTANVVDSPPYRKWMALQAETMRFIESAAGKPFCDFERGWKQGYKLQKPELGAMKTFTQMAIAKARYCAEGGDFKLAMHWLDVGLMISKHTRELTMLGMLLSIACESLVLSELQREIDIFGPNPEFRSLARAILALLGDPPSLREAMKGEALLAHQTMTELVDGSRKISDYREDGGWKEATGSERLWPMAFELPGVKQDAHAKVLGPSVEASRRWEMTRMT